MGVAIIILSITLIIVSAIGIFFILKSAKYKRKFKKAENDYYSKSAQLNLIELEKSAWLKEKAKLEHELEEKEKYSSYIRVERPEIIKLSCLKRLSAAQLEFIENEEEVEKLVKSEIQRDLAEQMMNYVEICKSKDIVNYEKIYRAEVHIVEYRRY
jgi:hypothetical protein